MTAPKPNSSGASGVIAEVDIADLERRAEASPVAQWRERAVRAGDEPPLTEQEHVWAREGQVARDENVLPISYDEVPFR